MAMDILQSLLYIGAITIDDLLCNLTVLIALRRATGRQ
jgi:hypothetical protein